MPDTATVEVRMPDGKVWTIPKESLVRAKLRGAVEYTPPTSSTENGESALTKIGRGTTLGAARGAGIPETQNPLKDMFVTQGQQSFEEFKKHPIKNSPLNPFFGIQQLFSVLKGGKEDFDEISRGVNRPSSLDVVRSRVLKTNMPQPGPMDPEAISHGLASLLTKAAMLKGGKEAAETPLAESETLAAGRKVAELPPKVVQNVTGAKRTTNAAQAAAEESAAAKRSAYEKEVAESDAEYAVANAKRDAKIETDKIAAEAKHKAEMDATKRGYGESVSQAERAKIAESRLEGQKRSLSDLKDRYSEQAAENLEKAEGAEKASLDKRYQDFREKVLGVSKENPNGLLHADLSQVAQSIIDARKNVLKGSKTSVPIFNDVLGRVKDIVETPEGELRPMEGQMIPVDQLRGYLTEINDALYERDLPNDVRNALKEVQKAGEAQVSSAIKDAHGQGAVGLYSKLKDDYSNYMETWRDTQSGSPLPAIRKLLKSPIAQKRGVPVYREVGRILEGTKGEKAIATVARKKGFGADPGIIAKLRAADKRLEGLPKSAGKIPVVKRPNFPQYKEPMAPAPVERKNVEPPEIEPFNRQAFMRNTIEDRLNWAGKLGQGYKILQMINDVVHMKGGAAASEAEQMAMIEAIKRALTSDKALNYFSKEN